MLVSEIIGRLGNNAEVKELRGRQCVVFSVPHTTRTKGQDGSKIESVLWVSCIWSGNGGKLLPYLKKGTKVFVRGNTSLKEYLKDGKTFSSIDISVTEIHLVGDKNSQEKDKKNNQVE